MGLTVTSPAGRVEERINRHAARGATKDPSTISRKIRDKRRYTSRMAQAKKEREDFRVKTGATPST